jgi:branched-chain amino acid transport system permease protein
VATTLGPVIGGLAVYFVPYWTENLRQGEASELIFGVVLIALMFVMPEGLMGLAIKLSRRVLRVTPQPPARLDGRTGPPPPDDTDYPAAHDGAPTAAPDQRQERNTA